MPDFSPILDTSGNEVRRFTLNYPSTVLAPSPLRLGLIGKALIAQAPHGVNAAYPAAAPTLHVDGTVGIGVANPFVDAGDFGGRNPLLRVRDYVYTVANPQWKQETAQNPMVLFERRSFTAGKNPVLWVKGGFIGQTDEADTGAELGSEPSNTKFIVIGTSTHETAENGAATANYRLQWKYKNFKKKRGRLRKKSINANMTKLIYDIAETAAGLDLIWNPATTNADPTGRYGVRMQWGSSMAALQICDNAQARDTVLSWGDSPKDRFRLRFVGRRLDNPSEFATNYTPADVEGGFDVMAVCPVGIVKVFGAIISYARGKVRPRPEEET